MQKENKITIGELIEYLSMFPKETAVMTSWEGEKYYLNKKDFKIMKAKDIVNTANFEDLMPEDNVVVYDD